MRLELDTIRTVAEYCRKKPSQYHHRCSGNNDFRHSASPMLDMWTTAKTVECWFRGRTNRMTPRCETCDGQHKEDLLLLTDSEKSFNSGIDRLVAVLEGDL